MAGMSEDHGKLVGHGRKCDAHPNGHGPLYPCEAYPQSVLDEIAASDAKYRANLQDPAWCRKQLDGGLAPEGLAIFAALAGVDLPKDLDK